MIKHIFLFNFIFIPLIFGSTETSDALNTPFNNCYVTAPGDLVQTSLSPEETKHKPTVIISPQFSISLGEDSLGG